MSDRTDNTDSFPGSIRREADDLFLDALLSEHSRLGSGDDKALLALIRARTEEQPESRRRVAGHRFDALQWARVAAVVALVGLALAAVFRNFGPGSDAPGSPNSIVASHAATDASPDGEELAGPGRTVRPKLGSAAPHTDPRIPAIGPPEGVALGSAWKAEPLPAVAATAPWLSPLNVPLSQLPLTDPPSGGTLTLQEIRTLLASGDPLPADAVSSSSLLRELDLPMASLSKSTELRADAATCPWDSDHRLVNVLLSASTATAAGNDEASPELLVEFNPAQVARYRLLGFAASRQAANQSLHANALYEIQTVDHRPAADTDLKYRLAPADASRDLLSSRFDTHEATVRRHAASPWPQADSELQLAAAATLFADFVASGRTPRSGEIEILERLMPASDSASASGFRTVVSDWRAANGFGE